MRENEVSRGSRASCRSRVVTKALSGRGDINSRCGEISNKNLCNFTQRYEYCYRRSCRDENCTSPWWDITSPNWSDLAAVTYNSCCDETFYNGTHNFCRKSHRDKKKYTLLQ